jgi:hypothetical protein
LEKGGIGRQGGETPVILPPGRAKLGTSPLPTGSVTATNTIGIDWLSSRRAVDTGVPFAKITSGVILTSAVALARMRSATLPSAQRTSLPLSILTFEELFECRDPSLTFGVVRHTH